MVCDFLSVNTGRKTDKADINENKKYRASRKDFAFRYPYTNETQTVSRNCMRIHIGRTTNNFGHGTDAYQRCVPDLLNASLKLSQNDIQHPALNITGNKTAGGGQR